MAQNTSGHGQSTLRLWLTVLLLGNMSLIGANGEEEEHDFHVSVTRIDYNAETQSLEVAIKIFTDDLEKALHEEGAPELRLGSERESALADSLIALYLERNVEIEVNEKARRGTYLGKEVEYDVTWCYLEYENISGVEAINIRNALLTEIYPDQSNLVQLYLLQGQFSMLLRRGNTSDFLNLD